MSNDLKIKKTIPIEQIASFPFPGNTYPDFFKFSKNNKYLAYLKSQDNSLIQALWMLNLENNESTILFDPTNNTSEDDLTPAEKLRRERQRQMKLGISNLQWAKNVNTLLFSDGKGVYIIDFELEKKPIKIIDLHDKEVIDPQISPDGNWIAFVQENDIHLISINSKNIIQLTHGGTKNGVMHGLAEYVAQEEMARKHGFWWCPDSKKIAFTEIREDHIPIYRIIHQGKEKYSPENQEIMRYPFAGERNAIVKLGVVNIHKPEVNWMNLGENEDIYLTRVNWFTENILTAQIENREQTLLTLNKFDISTGQVSIILEERSNIWINLHDMLTVLNSKSFPEQFIWVSEKTGYKHAYLYDFNGNLIKQLTGGDFIVTDIAGFNDEKALFYAITTEESPTERHLYEISLVDCKRTRITSETGIHSVTMNKSCNMYVDTFNSLEQPPIVIIKSLTKGDDHILHNYRDPRIDEFNLPPPKIISLIQSDETKLFGAIFKPDKEFGEGPFPTIVYVYGGPHPQLVTNSWGLTSNLRIQNLRNQGYLVFVLDNRGSGNRGLKFESVLKYNFGHTEVEDQVFGIEWLINQGLTDKNRVGIYGWSYGGYMTLMCLSKAPHIFKIGFAGAPTNDMRDYDTHYTERYMGKPDEHTEDYLKSSVHYNIKNMTGKLFIAHGLIDENVHFRHTAKIINSLIQHKKNYSFILFPDGRHSLRKKEDKIYLEEKLEAFFKENL